MGKVLEFFKKQRVSFYLTVFAAIMALAGLIAFGVSNGVQGYSMSGAGWMIFLAIAAILIMFFAIFAANRLGEIPWIIAMFIATIILCVCFGFLLANRVSLPPALLTYDTNNPLAWSAFNTAVVSIVFYLISAIALSVTAFLKFGTKDKPIR